MLRLSGPGFNKLAQAHSFDVCYGGSEANLAVSLANYGVSSMFVTKLPKNEVADAAINSLRTFKVDVSHIARGGDRIGIYFLENGISLRPSKVIYDRAHSSISEADISDFDLSSIFSDVTWFHFTGITAALSAKTLSILQEFLKFAKSKGIMISVDLNYRNKLWSPEEAQKSMIPLMEYVDICIGNEEDAEKVLNVRPSLDSKSGKINYEIIESMFLELKSRFGFKYIASSLRESVSATENLWSGALYDGVKMHYSKRYSLSAADRVGAGDSFSAGIIYGFLNQESPEWTLDFAVAASALKHTILGDFNRVSKEEVLSLMHGNVSGRIQR